MDAIIEKKNRRSISTHIKILTRIGALPDEYKNIIHRSSYIVMKMKVPINISVMN
jgi:hypothetical protein